ncbi:MAG: hypothetical protein AAF628_08920 [Planctomycetota bacterium]
MNPTAWNHDQHSPVHGPPRGGTVGVGRGTACLLVALFVLQASCALAPRDDEFAAADGGAPAARTEVTAAEIRAQFGPAQTIRGRVVDGRGRPVEGAALYAGIYDRSAATPSDEDGCFTVGVGRLYPNGTTIALSLRANGLVPTTVDALVGEQDLRVVLRRGAAVRGAVVVPAGLQLPEDLAVSVQSGGDTQVAVVRDGRFATSGVEPSQAARLVIRIDGFVPWVVSGVELTEGATLDLGMLELDPGATLTGTVRDAFDEPVEGATLQVTGGGQVSHSWYASCGPDGVARVRGLPRGVRLKVAAVPPEGFGRSVRAERVERTLTIEDAARRVSFLLHRAVRLRGRLVWSGAGSAPWADDTRLEVRSAARSASGERWRAAGGVPTGPPLGKREHVEFGLWARPGTWDVDIEVRRPGSWERSVARIEGLEIPVPARGERSGLLDVGALLVRRRAVR